jgi:hypothetical protein
MAHVKMDVKANECPRSQTTCQVERVCGQTLQHKVPPPHFLPSSLTTSLSSLRQKFEHQCSLTALLLTFSISEMIFIYNERASFFSSQNTPLVSRSVSSTWKIPLSSEDIFPYFPTAWGLIRLSRRVFIETILLWEMLLWSYGDPKVGNNHQKRLRQKASNLAQKF